MPYSPELNYYATVNGKSHLTINEIARLAGVSKGTVSKVLNNYRGINEDTRKRVLRVVEQMGYEPNSAAQALAFKRNGNIGLIIPHTAEHSLNGAYWSTLITAVTKETIAQGFNLMLLLPREEGKLEDLFTSINRKKQLDGLIVGSEFVDKKALVTLLYNDMPFVLLGKNPDFNHFAVDIDNQAAAHSITTHLIRAGYSRIALVCGPMEYYYNNERDTGYRKSLQENNLTYAATVSVSYDDKTDMETKMNTLFRTQRPDAVISAAGGDFMFDCLSACRKNGAECPETGFVTFDDYRYLEFTTPRITSVTQPISGLGAEAVKMLTRLLNPEPPAVYTTILETSIIQRDSCRTPAGPPQHT